MASSLQDYMALLESEKFTQKTFEEQTQIRQAVADAAVMSPEVQSMAPEERAKFHDMVVSSSKGMFSQDISENERALKYMQAAEASRANRKVDLNFIDGFSEGVKDFVSGKVGLAVADVFTANDLTQEVFDVDTEKARKYFDFISERYDVEGAADYKIAKILGKVGGFAGDAYGSTVLFGSVGAPGLVGKMLGFPSGAQAATMNGLAKAGLYIAQMGLEGVGYAGEELLASTIVGRMDSSEDWQQYLNSLPGTMAKGFAFALAGEIGGAALDYGKATARSVFGQGGHMLRPRDFSKMSDDDLMKNILDVMRAGEVTPQFRESMTAAGYSEDFIKASERSARRAKLVADSAQWVNDPEQAMKNTMFAQFDADVESLPDGFKVTGLGGKPIDKPILVSNQSEFVDAITQIKNIHTGREYDKAVEFGAINSGDVKFTVQTKGVGKALTYDPVKGREMFQPKNGTVDQNLYRELLDENDATKEFTIVQLDDYFTKGVEYTPGTVYIPKTITSPEQGRDALKQLSFQLSKGTSGNVKLNVDEMLDRLQKGRNLQYNKEYINDMLPKADIEYADGKVIVDIDGSKATFDSIEDLGATLHSSEFSDLELAAIMKDRGYAISMSPQGQITVKDDNTGFIYDTFDSTISLMKDPQYRPGRPYHKRWNFTLFSEGSGDVLGESFIAPGPHARQIKKLKGFETKEALAPTKNIVGKGSLTYASTTKDYVAEFGDSGLKKSFSSAKEAEEWLLSGAKTFRDFQNDALDQGFYVWESKGSYNLFAEGMEQPIVTNSFDNVKLHMKSQADSMNTPDMLGELPESVQEVLNSQYKNISASISQDLKKLGLTQTKALKRSTNRFVNTYKNFFDPAIDRIKKTGDLEAGRLAEQGVAVDNLFKADFDRTMKPFNELKKRFTPEQRSGMGQIMRSEMSPATWDTKAAEMGIELTPEMHNFMTFSRDFMDTAGQNFSVAPDLWIQDYAPRLMKLNPMDLAGANDAASRKKIINKAFGTDPGGLQDPFFKHIREEDVQTGVFSDDIFSNIETYMRLGKKEQYFKPFSDAVEAYKAKTAKLQNDPVALANRIDLGEMEDKMMGRMYSSERARELAEKLSVSQKKATDIMEGVGKYEKMDYNKRFEAAQQALRNDFNVSDLVTSSLMAFKFKMPFRNISQPMITLAPITGTEYIKRANKMMGDQDTFIAKFSELYNKGIIPPRSNIDSDLRGPVAWLKKATDKGMGWFYGSDDYTRMAAGISISERFRDGLTRFTAGDWDFDRFSKFIKLDFVDGQDKIAISEMVQKGQFDAAETSLQRIFTRMSMFEYSGLNKPRAHNSGFGKLFGQFGTYPLQFAQLVRKGVKAEGAAYLSKLVAANALVGVIYHDVFGVEGIAMNPMNSMTFLGGPMMSNFGQLSQIPQGGFTKQDLKVAGNIGTGFIPFWGAGKNAVKAVQNINEGAFFDSLYNIASLRATENRYFDTPEKFIEDYF